MRRVIRWLGRGLGVLFFLVLLAVAAVAGLVWLTLPGGDRTVSVAGLSAAVAISIDDDGIPRVRAASETDAARALGALHARERMFQMELMRRAASGELSELFGAQTLPFDRLMRTLGLRRAAEADLARLSPPVRALLDAYAAGVNAWIAARGRLTAPEFVAFGAPRPWTPVDSLLWGKTMSLFLSGNWRAERARVVLDRALGPAATDELWPDASGAGHPEAALAPSPAEARIAARLAQVIPEFPAPFTLPATASNAWAVDGAHSATGAPLLAGDPHLAFGFPSIWYLARLDTPAGVLAGATAPGVPFLVLGHNGHIAWSFTTTGADVQDLFVETPAGDGHYLAPDGPRPFETRTEIIHVAGAADATLTVRGTRHGPVISDLADPSGPVLALAAAELQPGDTAAEGLYALNRARSVADAGQAAPRITSPAQNLMVADRDGIGLFVTGRIPVRAAGDGARAAPGADGAHDWTGWAEGAALPHYVAPASGHLLNANDRIAAPDFPVFLGRDWYDDDRARRIRALLTAPGPRSLEDFAAMQRDVTGAPAQDLLPRLLAVAAPDGQARAAQSLLAGWNGAMTMDAPQPLIFNAWVQQFSARLLARIGVPPEGMAAVAPWQQTVRHALSPSGAHWCGGDCDPLLAESLAAAVADLSASYGADPARWRWGAAHVAAFTHPVLRLLPVLGEWLTPSIATPGDSTTIDRGGIGSHGFESLHGPEFRGLYDLADLTRSRFVMAPGQSGNPFSRLAGNFLQRWRDGASIALGAEPAQIELSLTLTPAQEPPR